MPLVEVTLVEGRSAKQLRALITALTEAVVGAVGAPKPARLAGDGVEEILFTAVLWWSARRRVDRQPVRCRRRGQAGRPHHHGIQVAG